MMTAHPENMQITAGTRLGPYEIIAPIGAGGMGEVFKARDTRLERSVAIKVLPSDFATNDSLKLRFEREAKTISQLNHPHICTLHDVGNQDGRAYLVMELLEGETLADRIARGPLPLADVLKYGAHIADALDRAHRAGITHRDLKPGNVMITRSGAKLLDFGLAKPQRPALISVTDETARETAQKPITQEGTILGTLQYMSPEQLEGREADHRTDIFAFGTVVYEMTTGKRAFIAKTSTSLIAAILKDEPQQMGELQPVTPPALEHIVTRCLAKDPEDRWQSASDIAAQLRWIGAGSTGTRSTKRSESDATRASRHLHFVPWSIAVLVIAVASFVLWRVRESKPLRTTKTVVSSVAEGGWRSAPAISPDGRHVAYPASGSLWIRSLDELEPRKLPLAGSVVFWSPDSKWVAFISEDKLWKIAPGGNTPILIASLPTDLVGGVNTRFHSGAWGADDRIVLSRYLGGLYETSAQGGPLVEWLPADQQIVDFHTLSFLPDGKTLLVVPHKLGDETGVEIIRNGKRQTILTFKQTTVSGVAYSPTGHILVSLGETESGVWAVPFSLSKMRPTGKQFRVAAGAGSCTSSRDGSLLYVVNVEYEPRQIVRIDRTGKLLSSIGEVADRVAYPVVSPDERSLAVMAKSEDGKRSVWLVDLLTGSRRRLTQGTEDYPTSWSRDGRNLLIHRGVSSLNWSDPEFGTWILSLNGSSQPRKVAGGGGANFTPDGKNILFLLSAPRGDSTINFMSLSGGKPVEILKTTSEFGPPAVSPDGNVFAYTSRDSGMHETYLARYPGGDGKWEVSRGPGDIPVWGPDGKTLYFQSGNRLMSVAITQLPAIVVGQPVPVFDAGPLNVDLGAGVWARGLTRGSSFQVLRDGSIIAIKTLPSDKRQLVITQNWLTEFNEEEGR